MTDDRVLRDFDDGVCVLTLNRPEKKNAFDDAQWLALAGALDDARVDPAVAVVVVTGAGGNFSAGQDLTAFTAADGGGDDPASAIASTPFARCIDALVAFDKPLLGAVTGVGVGIGATFLFHCDIVYVGEHVRLRLPFVNLGLVPEAASSYLLQVAIGSQRAAELFYTAEWIDAPRALETGIAARCVPDDEVLAATVAKAREIARWPVAALQATKRTLKAAHEHGIAVARATEDAGMAERAGSPENIEAVVAFLEKRDPDFGQFRRADR